jgi:hypothetical protein
MFSEVKRFFKARVLDDGSYHQQSFKDMPVFVLNGALLTSLRFIVALDSLEIIGYVK